MRPLGPGCVPRPARAGVRGYQRKRAARGPRALGIRTRAWTSVAGRLPTGAGRVILEVDARGLQFLPDPVRLRVVAPGPRSSARLECYWDDLRPGPAAAGSVLREQSEDLVRPSVGGIEHRESVPRQFGEGVEAF